MTKLKLGKGLTLDADVAGGWTFGVLAKKGAGKTYTGRVMAEEMHAAGVPFVALDPTGAWWGLRSSADGKSEGIPVAIFGGDHGDVPLEPTAGAVMADLVVDEHIPMVLDVSGFGTRTAERRFALEFLDRLYRRNRELVHLFVDEADLFAPQRPQRDDARLLGVMENLVRRGRIKGIGCTLITQRPAVLNKDVLTQIDVLVAMRIVSPQDRGAIVEWIKGHDEGDHQQEVIASLASLQNGESWWWSPEIDLFTRAQVRASRTFDSSPTPRRGNKRSEPKAFADVDLAAIGEKIAATIERADAEDPKKLRARIAELERQARQQERAPAPAPEPQVIEVVPAAALEYANAALAALGRAREDLLAELDTATQRAQQAIDVLQDYKLGDAQPSQQGAGPGVETRRPAAASPPRQRPAPAPLQPATPPAAGDGSRVDGHLSGSQQRILDALAWFEAVGVDSPRRSPLAAVAKSSPKSSGFEKNVSTLRTRGLIDYPAGGRVALTPDGRASANHPAGAATEAELQDAICQMVSGPQARLLRVLIDAYPDALERDELADRADVSAASSGFEKNVSTLRSFELIDYPGRGLVAALPILFLDGARR